MDTRPNEMVAEPMARAGMRPSCEAAPEHPNTPRRPGAARPPPTCGNVLLGWMRRRSGGWLWWGRGVLAGQLQLAGLQGARLAVDPHALGDGLRFEGITGPQHQVGA